MCPVEIVEEFIRRSNKNTDLNIETCGILAGIEQGSNLIITTLILPKQVGQHDTCAMTDDGEIDLFETQIKHGVMTLGWIHTHPQYVSHSFDKFEFCIGPLSVQR